MGSWMSSGVGAISMSYGTHKQAGQFIARAATPARRRAGFRFINQQQGGQ